MEKHTEESKIAFLSVYLVEAIVGFKVVPRTIGVAEIRVAGRQDNKSFVMRLPGEVRL